ncbi:kinase-like protein [Macrolepiota fuliginosa MF-IS2]|uniref:Kinase-like protein n=1 Tax=Macrolepiota fuliginosa MF-IS2 TaxID=1400762 RepID=A0A9P5XCU5_9AGAR|nr:kinase-like protein [Macrolepiota fuliginosa MF-IS2]
MRGNIIVAGIGRVSLRLAIYLSRQLVIYTWCQLLLRLQTLQLDAATRWDVAKSTLLNYLTTKPSRLLTHIPLNSAFLDSWVNVFLRYRNPPSLSGFDEDYLQPEFHDASCSSATEAEMSFLNDSAPDWLEATYTEDSEEPYKAEFTSPVALVPLSMTEAPPLINADLAPCSWASSITLSPSCKSLNPASVAVEARDLLERIERENDDQELYYDPLSLFDCTGSFMKDLHLDQCLGLGSFGTVFRGTRMDQQSYALKIMKQGSRVNLVIGLEVAALKRVSGNTQWAAQLEYIQFTQDHVLLALTYFSGGSLLDILEVCDGTIPSENAKFYVAQLILAIQSLHILGVIHHDIKLDNVLLDAQGNVKLIDFGLAVTFDHDTVSEERFPEFVALRKLGGDYFPLLWATRHNPHTLDDCFGTEGYAPPEVWNGKAHSYGVDYFGAACVYHWLITGTAPFEYDPETDDFVKDKIYIYREEFGISVDEYSFLSGALHERPHKRFTVSEMKNHPLFATVDWNALGRGELQPLVLPTF